MHRVVLAIINALSWQWRQRLTWSASMKKEKGNLIIFEAGKLSNSDSGGLIFTLSGITQEFTVRQKKKKKVQTYVGGEATTLVRDSIGVGQNISKRLSN